MTEEIHHRRKLPPIERFIRRLRDWMHELRNKQYDPYELLCYIVIGIVASGLVVFSVEAIRKARP